MSREYKSVDGLRENGFNEAADMLEFFLDNMRIASPHMNNQHTWMLRVSGWPLSHVRASTPEEAMRKAIELCDKAAEDLLNGQNS